MSEAFFLRRAASDAVLEYEQRCQPVHNFHHLSRAPCLSETDQIKHCRLYRAIIADENDQDFHSNLQEILEPSKSLREDDYRLVVTGFFFSAPIVFFLPFRPIGISPIKEMVPGEVIGSLAPPVSALALI